MSRKANTNPNKVNAFATVIDKDNEGNKLNTCTGNIPWNDADGNRQHTPIFCQVDNGKLKVRLDNEEIEPENMPQPMNNIQNDSNIDKIREAFNRLMEARQKRSKTSHIYDELDQLING